MWLPDPTAPAKRRKFPRFLAHEPVAICKALSGQIFPGTLEDLSSEGCLVGLQHASDLHVADIVELKLRSDAEDLHVMGAVRHTTGDGLLAGVEFLRDGTHQSNKVAEFLAELEKRSEPRPISPAFTPRPPLKPQDDRRG